MTASARSVELAEAAVIAAADKLASDLAILDVSERLVITDCFVLASAPNERQVRAIVEGVEERLHGLGARPVRREGEREGGWVLLDYVDVVVHIQHAEQRAYYALERLWKDCPALPLPDAALPPGSGADRAAGAERTGGAAGRSARGAAGRAAEGS
jgi:ribosome-associated protein